MVLPAREAGRRRAEREDGRCHRDPGADHGKAAARDRLGFLDGGLLLVGPRVLAVGPVLDQDRVPFREMRFGEVLLELRHALLDLPAPCLDQGTALHLVQLRKQSVPEESLRLVAHEALDVRLENLVIVENLYLQNLGGNLVVLKLLDVALVLLGDVKCDGDRKRITALDQVRCFKLKCYMICCRLDDLPGVHLYDFDFGHDD